MTVSAPARPSVRPDAGQHSRDDERVPFDQGGQLAAGTGAVRALAEPGISKILQEIRAFLAT